MPGKKQRQMKVLDSVQANLKPRQPKLRRTAKPGSAPKAIERKKPGRKETHGLSARQIQMQERREARILERAEAAKESGLLPHEWLLSVMRGEQISHYAYDGEKCEIVEVVVLPTFQDRMECGRAAAPYYAERLSGSHVNRPPKGGKNFDPTKPAGVMEVPLAQSMQEWADMAAGSQARLKQDVTK